MSFNRSNCEIRLHSFRTLVLCCCYLKCSVLLPPHVLANIHVCPLSEHGRFQHLFCFASLFAAHWSVPPGTKWPPLYAHLSHSFCNPFSSLQLLLRLLRLTKVNGAALFCCFTAIDLSYTGFHPSCRSVNTVCFGLTHCGIIITKRTLKVRGRN